MKRRARACAGHGALLVHVSTDYVFAGDADPERSAGGGYREDDPTGPTRNHYAHTKLLAEGEARIVPHHLIIRTSFRPREWPYPTAFTDVRTTSKAEAGVDLPDDVVLCTELWRRLCEDEPERAR